MAALVSAMMGLALWHFTIFVPDRFWSGIVGAFLLPLFGALLFGTTHGLQAGVSTIDPQLAGNLTYIIQGLIVLFVGADVLILYIWNSRRKLRLKAKTAEATS